MAQFIDFLLVLVLVLGLAALWTARPLEGIRVTALQGVALAAIVLAIHRHDVTPSLVFLAAAAVVGKGILIPWFLSRSVHEGAGQPYVKPYLGFTLSLMLGAASVAVAFWLASLLPQAGSTRLVVPVALSTVFIGMLLLVSRRMATNQVIGYLVLENGIFVFSFALASELPTLVEMGILLDLFVAVFIMGITIYQIRQEFDHIDTSRLRELHDLVGRERRWRRNSRAQPKVEG